MTNFWTLPVTVRGKASTKRIWRGIFWCEMWPRQKARTSVSSILFYSGTAFLAWRDNLLVTSLRH
ncbi:hypothetical protein [Rhizorhabdus wittichii]|uniref:hypothetical protein n=1 Tax=Rhizorhabdus wittichii TaxID=160791 RepID=UPI0002D43A5B|nr:hypothetical protein [Rhizorhabdus wittichii]